MSERIDIAFGFDARYVPHAANVIASIARHAPGADLRFIVLHEGVTEDRKAVVEALAPQAAFLWIEVGDDDLPAYADRGHLNRSVLFRLGLEKLAPAACKRLLYVDADTIVRGDIRDLWATDLGDRALGAAPDCYVSALEFARKYGLPEEGANYFNAGVLVIDLEKVRAERLFSAALDFVVKHDKDLLLGDQDALNYVFWRRWKGFEPTWNVQRYATPEELAAEPHADRRWGKPSPQLIHYIGMEKPWMRNAWHPWAWLYWESLLRTPFAGEVRAAFKIDASQLMRFRLRYALATLRTWWARLKSPAPRAAASEFASNTAASLQHYPAPSSDR